MRSIYNSWRFKYIEFEIDSREWYLPLHLSFNAYTNMFCIFIGFLCFQVGFKIPRKYLERGDALFNKFQDKYWDLLSDHSDEIGENVCKILNAELECSNVHLDLDEASRNKIRGSVWIDFKASLKDKVNAELKKEIEKAFSCKGINSHHFSSIKTSIYKLYEAELEILFIVNKEESFDRMVQILNIFQGLRKELYALEEEWIDKNLEEKK